jgi:hypothetical protein
MIPFREPGSPLIESYWYFKDRIPYEALIRFRHSISLRDAYGSSYSPLYAGDVYADQEDRFMAIFDQVLGGPRPSLLISAKDSTEPLGETERKRLSQDIKRQNSGGEAGGLLVVNPAIDVTPLSYSPADLAGMQVSEYDRTNLAAIFGLPPTYFTTETNLANLEAADAFFARFGVEPMCRSIAKTLTRIVQSWDRRLYFQFDPVLAEDELKKAQVDKIYVDMGAVTLNQLNEEKKYPPVEWGNEPIFPNNMVPWSMLIEQLQQGIASQQAATEQGKAKLDLEAKKTDWEIAPEPEPDEEDEGGDAAMRALAAPAALDPWAADADVLALARTLAVEVPGAVRNPWSDDADFRALARALTGEHAA